MKNKFNTEVDSKKIIQEQIEKLHSFFLSQYRRRKFLIDLENNSSFKETFKIHESYILECAKKLYPQSTDDKLRVFVSLFIFSLYDHSGDVYTKVARFYDYIKENEDFLKAIFWMHSLSGECMFNVLQLNLKFPFLELRDYVLQLSENESYLPEKFIDKLDWYSEFSFDTIYFTEQTYNTFEVFSELDILIMKHSYGYHANGLTNVVTIDEGDYRQNYINRTIVTSTNQNFLPAYIRDDPDLLQDAYKLLEPASKKLILSIDLDKAKTDPKEFIRELRQISSYLINKKIDNTSKTTINRSLKRFIGLILYDKWKLSDKQTKNSFIEAIRDGVPDSEGHQAYSNLMRYLTNAEECINKKKIISFSDKAKKQNDSNNDCQYGLLDWHNRF